MAEALAERGVRAEAYHGGLPAARRREVEAAFAGDQVDVVVATTAFGMGIDKPDVRFVYHHDVADSPDSYYQEIGRAGRDGEPAEAVLFYRPEDLGLRKFFAGGGGAGPDEVAAVADAGTDDVDELVELTGLSRARVTAALNCLGDDGEAPAVAAARAHEEREARARIQQSRVDMMRAYAEARGCRRQVLLGYFGEPLDEPCGNCDRCAAGPEEAGAVRRAVPGAQPGLPRHVGPRAGHGLRGRHGDGVLRDRGLQDPGPGAGRGGRAAHAGALSWAGVDPPATVALGAGCDAHSP